MTPIHEKAQIGAVALTVRDLPRLVAFYQDSLGLVSHRQDDRLAVLGAGRADLLYLFADPEAPRPGRRTTGLYHFAILVPSRSHLALALNHLARTETPLQGFSDHLVSEAIYLADPEGNGIEIYRDRPREQWPWANGQLQMATDPLDLRDVLSTLPTTPPPEYTLDPGTTIGHIHLQVSTLPETEQFYRDVLGMDLMVQYGNMADFFSAGGYHHHIGANTWAGVGAPPPPVGATGLRWYELALPHETALAEVAGRLDQAGIASTPHERGFLVQDPSRNTILLSAS
jgi:catechol 2,3-dioxygenase